MKLNELNKMTEPLGKTTKMPVLFLGHGSPVNAIEENEFVTGFRNIAMEIPRPNAILCISAHWETKGTFVTAMESPGTIHDFGGFPKEGYDKKSKDDVLLLQIDTDQEIMFGDSGVENIFININELKNLNFEKAYFNWDCC